MLRTYIKQTESETQALTLWWLIVLENKSQNSSHWAPITEFRADAGVFYSAAAPRSCWSHLDQFSESWQPELVFRWGVFTLTQLFSSRSRKSTQIQLILCCNKETSPKETVAELIRMMPRKVTLMITVINILTITGKRLIEGTYFSPGFVYTVAIFHAPVTHIDHAQLQINFALVWILYIIDENTGRWWKDTQIPVWFFFFFLLEINLSEIAKVLINWIS